jgi:hypothetical protein
MHYDCVTDGRTPWRVATARCGAYDTEEVAGAPRQCGMPVTHAGLRLGGEPVEAWLSFACDVHRDKLIAARLLLDRDRDVLDDWRERERRALDGKGWDPPQPLAVGSAARELVRQAWMCESGP